MQPARKLLSLLFLVLMGTELTQVRASNAIFLPACEAPARPGARQSRGAAPHSPAPPWPGRGRGIGEGTSCTRRAGRGAGWPQTAAVSPRTLGPDPFLLGALAAHSLLRSSKGSGGGRLAAIVIREEDRAGGLSSELGELGGGCDPTPAPASLPLATVAALGAPELAVGMVPGRPDQGGQAAVSEAGVHCGLHVEV